MEGNLEKCVKYYQRVEYGFNILLYLYIRYVLIKRFFEKFKNYNQVLKGEEGIVGKREFYGQWYTEVVCKVYFCVVSLLVWLRVFLQVIWKSLVGLRVGDYIISLVVICGYLLNFMRKEYCLFFDLVF